MWTRGIEKVNETKVEYWCKYFEEASECYGINGGRISKLMLKQDSKVVYNYDRGLDVDAQTKEAEAVSNALIEKYN